MDIFISYASEQRGTAEEIALALRGEGHEVFFDRSEIPDGDTYDARIREAIRACDLLIFLVSPEAVSGGRYTLTELRFAEEKWPSPAGRVLSVMAKPTHAAAIPAYLRAVSILRPAGSVAAEAVAAVDRILKPRWMRLLRRYAAVLLAVVVVGGGIAGWRVVEGWRTCGEALRLAEEAKLHQGAGDYAAAWDRYASGLTACPGSREAAAGQERLAMAWLDNIRVTAGKETFTDIVGKVQPALSRAALGRDDRHAADALAHLGWGDFLRSRDGKGGLDPALYYQQALQRDPGNAYAHAFWGHYLMATGADTAAAKAHFDQALASSTQRAFVREMQIAAALWSRDPAREEDAVRIASEMRAQGESLPAIGGDSLASRLWNIYYARLVRGESKESFLGLLPAPDHLATFLWLFPAYAKSSNRELYLFMLAQLQAHNGDRAEALATYRSLLSALTARGESGGRMVDASRQAIGQLQNR